MNGNDSVDFLLLAIVWSKVSFCYINNSSLKVVYYIKWNEYDESLLHLGTLFTESNKNRFLFNAISYESLLHLVILVEK